MALQTGHSSMHTIMVYIYMYDVFSLLAFNHVALSNSCNGSVARPPAAPSPPIRARDAREKFCLAHALTGPRGFFGLG